ncbi:MAG: OmpW family protein, partial [bacterium]|nr:OmpW family protein [bacterium]
MKTRSGNTRLWALALACGLLILTSWPAAAAQGDWLIRLRGISVDPSSSSGPVTTNGAPIAGSGVTVDDDIQPELDITYMVADNWGLELILASSNHDVFGNGSLAAFGKILDA